MTHLLEASPLWPAALDHIRYNSPHPARLADFYVRAMGMSPTQLGASEFLLEAPSRSIVIGAGDVAGQPYSAFALSDDDHLGRYRAFLTSRHAELLPSPTALFDRNAFAVRDPDGRLAVFGNRTRPRKPSASGPAAGNLAGELQHVVVASARFAAMMEFYTDTLGFMISSSAEISILLPSGSLIMKKRLLPAPCLPGPHQIGISSDAKWSAHSLRSFQPVVS